MLEEWDTDLRSGDPLGFPGYAERVAAMDGESVRTGLAESPDFDINACTGYNALRLLESRRGEHDDPRYR